MNTDDRIANMIFGEIYICYKNKVEKKERTEKELLEVVSWLTGFSKKQILDKSKKDMLFGEFFEDARIPNEAINITGKICGVTIEDITNPLTKKVRILDRLVDELARGKVVEKIIRK